MHEAVVAVADLDRVAGLLPRPPLVEQPEHVADRLGEPRARRNEPERRLDRRPEVGDDETGGDEGRRPHLPVDAVLRVRQGSVSERELGGGGGVAGRDVAPHVAADLGPDPLPIGVAERGRVRRLKAVDQIAVRGPLRRVRLGEGKVVQPLMTHLLGSEAGSVLLEDVQAEDRVVRVVVARHEPDVPAGRFGPAPVQCEAVGEGVEAREIVVDRVRVREVEVVPDALAAPSLHGFAKVATSASSEPGSFQPIAEGLLVQLEGRQLRSAEGCLDAGPVRGFLVAPVGSGGSTLDRSEHRLLLRDRSTLHGGAHVRLEITDVEAGLDPLRELVRKDVAEVQDVVQVVPPSRRSPTADRVGRLEQNVFASQGSQRLVREVKEVRASQERPTR